MSTPHILGELTNPLSSLAISYCLAKPLSDVGLPVSEGRVADARIAMPRARSSRKRWCSFVFWASHISYPCRDSRKIEPCWHRNNCSRWRPVSPRRFHCGITSQDSGLADRELTPPEDACSPARLLRVACQSADRAGKQSVCGEESVWLSAICIMEYYSILEGGSQIRCAMGVPSHSTIL
jgi:hypothetical protein